MKLVLQDSRHFVVVDLKCFNISFWNIFSTAKHIWDPQTFHSKFGHNLSPLVIPNHKKQKFSISATYFSIVLSCTCFKEVNLLELDRVFCILKFLSTFFFL